MGWDVGGQAYLNSGTAPHFEVAVVVHPYNLTTAQVDTFTYWSSHHEHVLPLGGVTRTLTPTYGALRVANPVYVKGTDIRTLDVSLFGLGDQARALLQGYRLRLAAAEIYQLVFTPGLEYKGQRRAWNGDVDASKLEIGEKGGAATLTVTIATRMRRGTVSIAATKSDASYRQRMVDVGNGPEPDTIMEYAALQDVESDPWGSP